VREWTKVEDALICKLRKGGASNSEIAPHFPDRTREAVARRIRILIREGRLERQRAARPLGNRPWTTRDEALLMRLREREATLDEICERMPERTRAAIVNRIHELMEAGAIEKTRRASLSHRQWSPEEDELVALMRRAGKTMEEMAVALDRSLASINNRIAQRVRKGELPLLRADKALGKRG
jgi:predicted transcriptional regulator